MSDYNYKKDLYQRSLEIHSKKPTGKISMEISKPLKDKNDLALAYSPGVAGPCLEIYKNPESVYDYTSKSNFVAVITNGTAVLGLGDIGTRASKPVMEGKSCLFKRFADIDSTDIQVASKDREQFVKCVEMIGDTFGGINLEDISGPSCFYIESELKKRLDIPVFHDDQHGTAIIILAAMINACEIIDKKIKDVKIVINGSGAAGISSANLLIQFGVKKEQIIICDTQGVIYTGRKEGMNEWKESLASNTNLRTLTEAMNGCDIFIGCSVKGAVSKEMVKSMAKNPIIFAMANPDPEIMPDEIKEVRNDAIIGTGRSDFSNQVNNVMCFPYLFRGALDTRSKSITENMKIAAALSISNLAKKNPLYGKEYIIPSPFDKSLLSEVASAVAKQAIDEGVSRVDLNLIQYKKHLLELEDKIQLKYMK